MKLTLVTPSLFLRMAARNLLSRGVGARVAPAAPAWAGEDGGCPDMLIAVSLLDAKIEVACDEEAFERVSSLKCEMIDFAW